MITFEKSKKIIEEWGKNISTKKVSQAFEVSKGFVFLLKNRDKRKSYDSLYVIVQKKDGKVKFYSPLEDSKEFAKQSKTNLLV